MSDEIKYVREVCEAATPGPWLIARSVLSGWMTIASSADPIADALKDADASAIVLLFSTWREALAVIELVERRIVAEGRAQMAGSTDEKELAEAQLGSAVLAVHDAVDAYRAAVRAHRER